MTTSTPAIEAAAPPHPHGRGLDLVTRRSVLGTSVEVSFRLAPGDRPLVAPGDTVVAGTTIAERLRDPRLVELAPAAAGEDGRPGDRWTRADHPDARIKRGTPAEIGELVFEKDGSWRLVAGDHVEAVDCPVAGVVRDIRPGVGIRVRAQGRSLPGVEALGDPTSGRLSLGGDRGDMRHGRLRSTSLDVGLAGTILVIGSRVDAEALTRARAMGVRGVVVSGLAGKERRDFLASETRQRAALHRLPPFAVLILDGVIRRPIAGPIAAILEALAGPAGRDLGRSAGAGLRRAVGERHAAAARSRPGPLRGARRRRRPLGGSRRNPPIRRGHVPGGRLGGLRR